MTVLEGIPATDRSPGAAEEGHTYTALLVGATGLVGSALLIRLIRDKRCSRLTVIARNPMEAPIRDSGIKLNWIIAGLDRMEDALEGIRTDAVFCALGTTIKTVKTRDAFRKVDLEYPLRLARWAKNNGASVFLAVSALGASEQSSFFYSRVKGEMERKLAETSFSELHLFRPSLLLGKRKVVRAGERAGAIIAKLLSWAWIGPLRNFKPVRDEEVASAMAEAAADAVQAQKCNDTGRPAVTIYESGAIRQIAREITG